MINSITSILRLNSDEFSKNPLKKVSFEIDVVCILVKFFGFFGKSLITTFILWCCILCVYIVHWYIYMRPLFFILFSPRFSFVGIIMFVVFLKHFHGIPRKKWAMVSALLHACACKAPVNIFGNLNK